MIECPKCHNGIDTPVKITKIKNGFCAHLPTNDTFIYFDFIRKFGDGWGLYTKDNRKIALMHSYLINPDNYPDLVEQSVYGEMD